MVQPQNSQFLQTVYVLSHAGRRRSFNAYEIGRNLGLENKHIQTIVKELHASGLIEQVTDDCLFAISNKGLSTVEKIAGKPGPPATGTPLV
jgi:predicted transcriptional regulator